MNLNVVGKKPTSVEVSEATFGNEYNEALVHQV
ncbi:MAG: 50S ribosomal protein L4, partial [Natronospirillum sp.]